MQSFNAGPHTIAQRSKIKVWIDIQTGPCIAIEFNLIAWEWEEWYERENELFTRIQENDGAASQ